MAANLDNAGKTTSPLRILVAEDHEINSKVMELVLEHLGYQADFVGNGLDVLIALKSKTYDLIFMDIEMPKMGGVEATRQIVETMDGDKRPLIIAMTAHALPETLETCLEAGMNDYISKPFRIETVQQMIDKYFG